jgi:hypothetical protein
MKSPKVRCVYLVEFLVSEISQGRDKRIVPNLAGLAPGVRVPVKDILFACDVEEGRGSDSRASKEKSGAVEVLSDSEYFPCNGIDAVGRIKGPLKLSLTEAQLQWAIDAALRLSFSGPLMRPKTPLRWRSASRANDSQTRSDPSEQPHSHLGGDVIKAVRGRSP